MARIIKDKEVKKMVYILDKSGSMESMVSDVIGGFNAAVEKQKQMAKENDWDLRVSLFLFSNVVERIFVDLPSTEASLLDDSIYEVRGSTALYDAIGTTVSEFEASSSDVKSVLFYVFTDGEENASRKYDSEDVKSKIKELDEKGWGFVFMGAGLDAWKDSQKFGMINEAATLSVGATGKDIRRGMIETSAASLKYFNDGDTNLYQKD